jgi:hypothetical protein
VGIKRNRDDNELNVRIAWKKELDRQPLPTDFPLSYIKNKEDCDGLLLEFFETSFGIKPLF